MSKDNKNSLNDNIRSFFDSIGSTLGNNLRAISEQLTGGQQGKQKQTKQEPKTSTKGKSAKSRGSSGSRSGSRGSSGSGGGGGGGHRRSTRRVAMEQVYAGQLMPICTEDSSKQKHLPIEDYLKKDKKTICSVYFIHCAAHKKVAVSQPSKDQAVWMPFMPIPTNRTWDEAGLAGLYIILSESDTARFMEMKANQPFTEKYLMEMCDVEHPQTHATVTRLTWYVRLDKSKSATSASSFQCCKKTSSLVWLSEDEILSQQGPVMQYIWGRELLDILVIVKDLYQNGQTPGCSYNEFNRDMAMTFLPRNPPARNEEELLVSSNLSEPTIERLYLDFLDHCFPCMSMTVHSFKAYMTKYGIPYANMDLEAYFHAFNYNDNGSITFPELLMGLACIDPLSIQNETRAKFVVRYYDRQQRGRIGVEDLRSMLQDIHPNDSPSDINKRIETVMKDLNAEKEPESGQPSISARAFVAAIGSHKFRGTAKLCRMKQPIFIGITNAVFARMQHGRPASNNFDIVEPPYDGTCLGCKSRRPKLLDTVVKIDANGYVVDRYKLPQYNSSSTSLHSKSRDRPGSRESQASSRESVVERNASSVTTASVDINVRDVAHSLIKMVRDFAPHKGDTRNPKGLLTESPQVLVDRLEIIERALIPLIDKQGKCVRVESPALVMGDIHGNLADLISLENAFWKRIPVIGVNLVFLGDMVDRGKWGVECVTYLLSLKALMPDKVTLLRGNHEVRTLQRRYSYLNECLSKYGEEQGMRFWNLTNRIFDRLPLCAIVDEALYCAHGGIPRSCDLRDLAKLPSAIEDPEHLEIRAPWDILWSDPLPQPQFEEQAHNLQVASSEGFLPNQKRGTAWHFNGQAVQRFLSKNGLSHMVRAHEVPPDGFCFNFEQKCTTIFSCSHYCFNNNDCAVLLVDRDLIRVVRIDTTNNKSATD